MGGGGLEEVIFFTMNPKLKKIDVGVGGGLESVNFLHKDFKSKKKKMGGGGGGGGGG